MTELDSVSLEDQNEATESYPGVLGLGGVEIGTDSNVAGVLDAGHEVADEDILLLDNIHIKEKGEGFAIEDGDYVRIDIDEEGERRRDVGTEHGALVLVDPLPEERLRALEPEVVEAVGDRAEHRPAVAARNRANRGGRGRRRWS